MIGDNRRCFLWYIEIFSYTFNRIEVELELRQHSADCQNEEMIMLLRCTHLTSTREAWANTPACTITSAAKPDDTDPRSANIVVRNTTTEPRPTGVLSAHFPYAT